MASGRGSNLRAIVSATNTGELSAVPAVLVSDHSSSGAMTYARQVQIPCFYLSQKTHPDPVELDSAITNIMHEHDVDIVVLAGYMKKIGHHLLEAFRHRIINIHPSLLPKFGGKGMYGIHVHEAVIAAGEKETGVTIHLVDEEYDEGRILAQQSVPVMDNDTPDTLATRVLATEHMLYVDTIKAIIEGRIEL